MGKAKGKKGRRQQDSDDDDDFVDPIKAALAAAGDDDDGAAAAPAKKAPKKKKGRQGKGAAAAEDDEEEAAAAPPPPAPAPKKKKGGKFRGDSSEDEAPAPATEDANAPKKLSRAQLRKQKLAKKAGRAEEAPAAEPAAAEPAAVEPEEDEDEDEDTVEFAAPVRKKKDKKAARRAAAMAAMLADEASEEEAEAEDVTARPPTPPTPEAAAPTKKKMSKAERRRAKAAPAEEDVEEAAAPAPAPLFDAEPKKGSLFGGDKKKEAATTFAAAMAAAEDRDDTNADAQSLRASLEKYAKKLKKAGPADAAKYEAKIAKYEARLAALAAESKKKALAADAHVDAAAALAAAGGLLGDDDVWRDDANDHHARGPQVEATFELCLAAAVAANGAPLGSKAKRKLEKTYASKKREAEAYAAKEQASLEGAQFACSQSAVDERDATWLNALDVKIDSFTISAAGKTLFENSSLLIAHGRRYGIVGPNGRGKTTLLKMIASGDLKVPPRVQCLYVEQEVQADDTSAVDAVLKADVERTALLKEEASLISSLETLSGTEQRAANDRLQIVGEELQAIGASAADAKARRILFGLGFSPEMQVRATKLFSGGWRMRISLARALFVEPILLMLDEPTNHLDLNAVIWLDDYLQKYKHTILVVSHDQDFLNSVCDETLHISEHRTLDHYRGNYDTFKQLEKQKMKQQQKAWEKQEKQLKVLKSKGKTGGVSKAKAEALMKVSRSKREPKDKKKQQAIASGQDTADVQTLIERPKEYAVEMEFPPVPRLAPPVLQVMDAQFRYAPSLPLIFTDMNFGIDQDSRICVVGNNGSGKTTLLNLLTGKLQCSGGDVKRNPKLRIGVYNQHFVERLPMDESPVDYLRRLFEDENYQSVRNMLGRYGLQGHAHTITMRDLSGGQKARVVLCELSLAAPHMLLLDEPTNNLDIETIDALCDAINGYDGGVICVTHDARLIEATDMRLWVVEDRRVVEWGEPFEAYRDHLLEKLEAAIASSENRVTAAGVSVDMGGNR